MLCIDCLGYSQIQTRNVAITEWEDENLKVKIRVEKVEREREGEKDREM